MGDTTGLSQDLLDMITSPVDDKFPNRRKRVLQTLLKTVRAGDGQVSSADFMRRSKVQSDRGSSWEESLTAWAYKW